MMIRMSKTFAARWKAAEMDGPAPGVVLDPRLATLIEAPFVRRAGCLLLEPLAMNATGADAFPDRTGYEAFINKLHVEDYVDEPSGTDDRLVTLLRQGVRAAIDLSKRLELAGPYRVLLSLDPDERTVTLRFFERREGEPWGSGDPDSYALEEVAMVDTGS